MRTLVLTIGLVAALAAPAAAATVSVTGDVLVVDAPADEANILDVERIGLAWEVTDSRAPLTAGAGCAMFEARRARCTGNVFRVKVSGGPRDDLIAVWDAAVPVELDGGAGDDLLEGASGADVLIGGPGLDALVGGAGDDRLSGLAGDDLLQGGKGRDDLRSGAGADIVEGGAGDDALSGGLARDLLNGGAGFDVVAGGAGRDAVIDNNGSDRLKGSSKDDVYEPGFASCLTEPAARPAGKASECSKPRPPRSWPPRRRRPRAGASAIRRTIRTYARLRTIGRARATSVKVASVASFRAEVVYTTYGAGGRQLKRQRARVDTRFWQTIRIPTPPIDAHSVKARCTCQN